MRRDMQKLAEELKIPFLETSAKESTNVEQAFIMMASEIKKRIGAGAAGGGRPVGPGAAGSAAGAKVDLGRSKPVQQPSSGRCC